MIVQSVEEGKVNTVAGMWWIPEPWLYQRHALQDHSSLIIITSLMKSGTHDSEQGCLWMDGVGERQGGFGIRKPLHAVPPIKNWWNQAIFERVIGSLVTALHHFKIPPKIKPSRPHWWLVADRKNSGCVYASVRWRLVVKLSRCFMLSQIWADFLVFVRDFNNPSAQELLMARQCDRLLTGLRAAGLCVCVLTAPVWASPMSLWIPFEPFSPQKRVKEINQVLHLSLLWLLTLTDSSANQRRAHWNAPACILTNGINRNCLQMSKLMDMSVNINAGEMSRLLGQNMEGVFALIFQTTSLRVWEFERVT